jgi:negative regulator of flagellin synthesis FlgM
MKITHNKVGQNLNLTDATRTDKSKKSEASSTSSSTTQTEKSNGLPFASNADSSKVDLSSRAKEIAMASPDVDQAKVEKFQKLIDDGKYKVDAKAIAERMVEEHLMSGKTSEN